MSVAFEKLVFSWKRRAHIRCPGNAHLDEVSPAAGVPVKGMVPGREGAVSSMWHSRGGEERSFDKNTI